MNKYMLTKAVIVGVDYYNITITDDDINFVSFLAEIGQPNYEQFLLRAELTDKQVHELTPDIWYDFQEETA